MGRNREKAVIFAQIEGTWIENLPRVWPISKNKINKEYANGERSVITELHTYDFHSYG